MSSLSSKITTLEVKSPASHPPPPQVGFTQVPAEPRKGNTSSPEAATSRVGESSESLPPSILASFLLLPLTLIQAAILLASGTTAQRAAQQQQSKKIQQLLLATAQANHPTSWDLASAVDK